MRQEKKGLLAGFQKLSCAVVVKMRDIIGSNRKEQNMTALMQTHTQRHLVLLCREVRSHCSHSVRSWEQGRKAGLHKPRGRQHS